MYLDGYYEILCLNGWIKVLCCKLIVVYLELNIRILEVL